MNTPLTPPLLTVVCTTYNQAPYVLQTLQGFALQHCSYPFEVLIHDDASTDATADIIRHFAAEHPGLCRLVLQSENQYSKGIDIWQALICRSIESKYIAFCEGDDYWTDPEKLQRQLDFMESHPDYDLVYTKARVYLQKSKQFGPEIGHKAVSLEKVLRANPVVTLTALLRRDVFLRYTEQIDPPTDQWKMSDYPLWIYIAHFGKIHFMDYVSGVYRVLPDSASNFTDIQKARVFFERCMQIRQFFAEKYLPALLPQIEELYLYETLYQACVRSDAELRRSTRRAMRLRPDYHSNKRLWLSHKLSFMPVVYLLTLKMSMKFKKVAND